YELIDGELLVTPSPGSSHATAVTELTAILLDYLRRERVGVLFLSPSDLELRPGTITQPDLFIVPVGNEPPEWGEGGWSDVGSLLLAVEIISPSSVRTDRITKRDYYLDVGVPDYFIVDVDARIIEWWTQRQDTPRVLRDQLAWHPIGAKTALTIRLPEFFDRISEQLRSIGIRAR
ncbi:MAG: hypothetical protein JWL95_45, partial [Gemmatimonadetes bacterium]|nr:hypothetical protein [Gemmatimonadota bacterium]